MNLLVILTLFVNYLCVNGAPAPVSALSVYETIQLSAKDPKLNCTELRSSPLLKPEPQFLTNCIYNDIIGNVDHEPSLDSELCLLYYSNVMNLCKVSNNIPKLDLLTKLKEDVNNQHDIKVVCETIIKESQNNVYDEVKVAVESTIKKLDSSYCSSMCLISNLYVRPECILNAFMLKTAASLNSNENTKSIKPLHTIKSAQETPDSHQEPLEVVVQGKPLIDDNPITAPQSNANDKSVTVEKKVNVQALSTETKKEQNDDQPDINLNGKSSTLNPSDSGNVQNYEPVPGDAKEVQAAEVIPQVTNQVKVNKQPDPAPDINNQVKVNKQPDPAPDINNQPPKTSLVKQDENKANANIDNKSEQKLGLNSQEGKLGKTETTKLPEQKKTEENNLGVPETDFTIDKQDTGNNGLIGKTPIEKNPVDKNVEKNQVESNVEKEETSPDLGGDGEDMGAGINEGEDYPEVPNDNSGMPELSLGNPAAVANEKPKSSEVKSKITEKQNNKPSETNEDEEGLSANYQNQSIDDSDSYFFSYFMMVCIMFICGYVAYHNKQKILALVVEGRRGRRTSRSRRPNSANYRKLDSNLEEAVTSSCNKNTTQIIY